MTRADTNGPAMRPRRDDASVSNDLGVSLERQERYREAVEQFRRAVEAAPRFVLAWANLSNALRKAWRPEEAEQAARRALELEPNSAEAYNALGAALLDQNKLDEALGSFDWAL